MEYLGSLPTAARTTGPLEGVLDIHTAQELHMAAEVLDLLLGAEVDALGDHREAAILGVADLGADFYADHMLDDSVPATHPAWSSQVHTRWGQTIDSVGGHEHPDPLALLRYAGTEALVLDSGHLGWGQHHKVNAPENHSLILVDGLGAQGYQAVVPEIDIEHDGSITFLDPSVEGGWTPGRDGQGWIVAHDLAEPSTLSVVHAVTRYEQEAPATELSRTLALLGGRYAVLLDQASSADGLQHDYTHRLHLNCGGTSGALTELDLGATCERPGSRGALSPGGHPEPARGHPRRPLAGGPVSTPAGPSRCRPWTSPSPREPAPGASTERTGSSTPPCLPRCTPPPAPTRWWSTPCTPWASPCRGQTTRATQQTPTAMSQAAAARAGPRPAGGSP